LLERVKDTVGDVAETIKRAFTGPAVHSGLQFLIGKSPDSRILKLPNANISVEPLLFSPALTAPPLLNSVSVVVPVIRFDVGILLENGGTFKADAKLMSIPLISLKTVMSAEIPGINMVAVKRVDDSYSVFLVKYHALQKLSLEQFDFEKLNRPKSEFGGKSLMQSVCVWTSPAVKQVFQAKDVLKPGNIYRFTVSIGSPRCFVSVETALSVPITIRSADVHKIPKAMWMRYMLQVVKKSGENIRNLEIIGMFNIPQAGIKSLKHDGSDRFLRIVVGPDAQNSKHCNLILARKKSDSAVVSCILDED